MRTVLLDVAVHLAFLATQGVLWALVIRAWLRSRAELRQPQPIRTWLAWGSLICGSITLALTAGMTVYSWSGWQRYAYDKPEYDYVAWTICISLLGIVLGIVGKRSPRLIGLLASVATLSLAILDAAAK